MAGTTGPQGTMGPVSTVHPSRLACSQAAALLAPQDDGQMFIAAGPFPLIGKRPSSSVEYHQKSGTSAFGIGRAAVPGKKEFGFWAQISSVSGPSGALASC